MPPRYEKKYDRQIRVFGFTTQEKLQNMRVTLYTSTNNYVSAEIVKNLVLLGVADLKINKRAEECVLRMIPGGIKDINEKLRLEVFDDAASMTDHSSTGSCSMNEQEVNVTIQIDNFVVNGFGRSFYVCSKCCMFGDTCDHHCVETEHKIENECLLGAVLVQEMVKMLSGENYQKEYRLDV